MFTGLLWQVSKNFQPLSPEKLTPGFFDVIQTPWKPSIRSPKPAILAAAWN
jgi:hypothetical protein